MIILLRSIQNVVCINSCWVFLSLSMVWMDHSLCNHSPVERHQYCFHFFANMNEVATNIHVLVFVSYGKFKFSFLRNHHTLLQSGCTVLYSHQQYINDSVSPHPHQHLVLSLFYILIFYLSYWLLQCLYIHNLSHFAGVVILYVQVEYRNLLPLCLFISLFIFVSNSSSKYIQNHIRHCYNFFYNPQT